MISLLKTLLLVSGLLNAAATLSIAATVIYQNDFDNAATTTGSVTASVSGGLQTGGPSGQEVTGGITGGQGLTNLAEFSGNLFRVTAADDQLVIQISNIGVSEILSVDFSLAFLDSWDGDFAQFGDDSINVNIYDGAIGSTSIAGFSQVYGGADDLIGNSAATLIEADTQRGFNNSADFFNEDSFSIGFDDLQVSTGTLTFVISASSSGTGSGFQGGDDESFAIDNFIVTSNIPEPSTSLLLSTSLLAFAFRRKKTA